jgi:DNA-binding transcriptional ArsR family regulator
MDIFYALSAPNRRTILELLAARGQLSSTDISDKFSASPPAISQHLKILREAGLVQMEKQGQRRMYRIDPNAMLELAEWTGKITQQWNDRFDRLDKLLKAEQQQRHQQKQKQKQAKEKNIHKIIK